LRQRCNSPAMSLIREVEAPGCVSFTSLTAPAYRTCPGRDARRA